MFVNWYASIIKKCRFKFVYTTTTRAGLLQNLGLKFNLGMYLENSFKILTSVQFVKWMYKFFHVSVDLSVLFILWPS